MKILGKTKRQKLSNSRGSRGNLRLMSEINVTPFVDVMLVLLVIFMITAPMLTVGIEIEIHADSYTHLTLPTNSSV